MPTSATEFIQSFTDAFQPNLFQFVWMGCFAMVASTLTFAWLWIYRRRSAWLPIVGGMLLAYGTFVALAVALRWLDPALLVRTILLLLLVLGGWTVVYRISKIRRDQERRLARYPKGFLDHLAEFEANEKRWKNSYGRISRANTRFGGGIFIEVAKAGNLDENNNRHALRHVNAIARRAVRFAIEIDANRSEFQRYSEVLLAGFEGKIEHTLRVMPDYHASAKAANDRARIAEMAKFVARSIASNRDLIEKLAVVAGSSQQMNAGISEASDSLLGVQSVLERMLLSIESVAQKLRPPA